MKYSWLFLMFIISHFSITSFGCGCSVENNPSAAFMWQAKGDCLGQKISKDGECSNCLNSCSGSCQNLADEGQKRQCNVLCAEAARKCQKHVK